MRTFLLILNLFSPTCCLGAVVSTRFVGETEARLFSGGTVTRSSTLDSDSLSSLTTFLNSEASSTLDWTWDGQSLLASSELTAEKSRPAKRGGVHEASSLFVFEFTLDSAMQLAFDGTWGFAGADSGGDLLQLELTDAAGLVFQDSTLANGGITSDSFGYNGILGPGTYTFTIRADLSEVYRSRGSASGGWALSGFRFTAVPESGFGLLLFTLPVLFQRFRCRLHT